MRDFVRIGAALRVIREEKLYRIPRELLEQPEALMALETVRVERLYRAEFDSFEDYCLARWGITAEVAALIPGAARLLELEKLAPTKTPLRVDELPTPDVKLREAGFVYFILCESAGLIKIGTTTNLKHRFATLQSMSPAPLRFIKIIRGDAHRERLLHQRFASARAHGEWFRATDELLAFAESLPAEKDCAE